MNIIDEKLVFGSMTMNNVPKTLIVHHLGAEGVNWTVQAIHNMHRTQNLWAGIGYHYYIRLNGHIYKGRPDRAIGAHTQGANANALGIAFEGDYSKRKNMPAEQYNAWVYLKKYLTNIYGAMPTYGHREKSPSECPGEYFPLDRVKTIVETKLGWIQNSTGWRYCTDPIDQTYITNCWKEIDGEWYSFDSQGYARCNKWIQYKGKWYWLNNDCKMVKSKWEWIDGECYCFDDSGALYVDCITPDGYKVDKTGAWVYIKK